MHVVAVLRELAERHPWLSLHVYRAFAEAKRLAIYDLEQTNFLRVTLPWVELDTIRSLMGEDYWSYGLEANRAELEAVTRWSFAEGLSPREPEVRELFDPATWDLWSP